MEVTSCNVSIIKHPINSNVAFRSIRITCRHRATIEWIQPTQTKDLSLRKFYIFDSRRGFIFFDLDLYIIHRDSNLDICYPSDRHTIGSFIPTEA